MPNTQFDWGCFSTKGSLINLAGRQVSAYFRDCHSGLHETIPGSSTIYVDPQAIWANGAVVGVSGARRYPPPRAQSLKYGPNAGPESVYALGPLATHEDAMNQGDEPATQMLDARIVRNMTMGGLPTFADNTAALAGGLTAWAVLNRAGFAGG